MAAKPNPPPGGETTAASDDAAGLDSAPTDAAVPVVPPPDEARPGPMQYSDTDPGAVPIVPLAGPIFTPAGGLPAGLLDPAHAPKVPIAAVGWAFALVIAASLLLRPWTDRAVALLAALLFPGLRPADAPFMGDWLGDPGRLGSHLSSFIASALALVSVALAAAHHDRRELRQALHLGRPHARPWEYAALAAACLAVASLVEHGLAELGLRSGSVRLLDPVVRGGFPSFVGTLFFAAAVAPVAEELFFRGFVLSRLAARWRGLGAVAGSAALFGAIHLDLVQGLSAAAAGLLLGWYTLRTGSLWPAVIAHAANNAVSLLLWRSFGAESLTSRPAALAAALLSLGALAALALSGTRAQSHDRVLWYALPQRPVRPVIAFVIALLVPGLGHIHAGRLRRGLLWPLAIAATLTGGMALSVHRPQALLRSYLLTLVAVAALWLAQAALAAWAASRSLRSVTAPPPFLKQAVFGLLALGLVMGGGSLSRRFLIEQLPVPTAATAPNLLSRDTVLIVKAGPEARYVPGSLVAHRRKGRTYIGRVIALSGETVQRTGRGWLVNDVPLSAQPHVEGRGRARWKVSPDRDLPMRPMHLPEGALYVLNDDRGVEEGDSRTFGTVWAADVLGVVAHVSLSVPSGRRGFDRSRIGRSLLVTR